SQRAVLEYVSVLRPGANLLRNYLRLLAGIALRRGTKVEEVLQDKGLRRLLRDPQTARSGSRELMHKRLRELRYPQMHRIGERFESARRDLGLSPEVSLLPPQSFEGGRLRLTFEVESPRDLEARAKELLETVRSGKLQELFRCLGAPAGRTRGAAEGEQGDQEF
ncbi:MAG: hypothetical protein JXQ83_01630, partial [Candidatus Glassbacteria bacterium]|nr:hypothetical protein [Candidatus Glassbacteria bacterium]